MSARAAARRHFAARDDRTPTLFALRTAQAYADRGRMIAYRIRGLRFKKKSRWKARRNAIAIIFNLSLICIARHLPTGDR